MSRSNDNQTIKFCQLIEYNMRKIFLVKSYVELAGEASPGPFLKNQIWAYPWVSSFCFYCLAKSRSTKIY